MIETRELTKSFGDLIAVDDVSLTVNEGQFHSIIGPNGAGKSTLFNLITGLMAPTNGEVYFQGDDITGLSPHQISRRGLARSFQIETLFDGLTVEENLTVAAQILDDRRRSMWRRSSDLEAVRDDVATVLEDLGLSTQAGMRAGDLAYGDRRKIEIGLAIATDPTLLLLDEPTAGMSAEEVENTMDLILRLSEERNFTVLLIEHDLELVMRTSDRVTVLHEGAVIADGDPEAIRDDDSVQEAYIGGAV